MSVNPAQALIWAAGVVIGGAVAAAACPVASDLETGGVRFLGPDGLEEVHTRLDDSRVQIDLYETDVPGTYRSIMIHGVYIQWLGATFENGRVDPGSIFLMSRDIEPGDMPVPTPGLTWTITQQFTDVVGGTVDDETMTITVSPATTWTLGACDYEMLPVTVSTISPFETFEETLHYLPELRTAVLVGYSDSGASDTYVFNDIAVEAQ